MTLKQTLQNITHRGRWRFHFPAHAGHDFTNTPLDYAWDQTELPELDVLGSPDGVLLESQKRCAKLFGAAESFYLINGASVGLMAALLALPSNTEPVLIARNAHRSVVHGLVLSGIAPVWVLPENSAEWGVWGEITIASLQAAHDFNPTVQAVILTYPTYEGVCSDISSIANWCREKNLILIIDEAHGALWNLSDNLPVSAIQAGADIVVHSLHKSAGALTQCAALHLGVSSHISGHRIQQALNLLQTTSPSYLLLANIESTCDYWASESGENALTHHTARCHSLKQFIESQLKNIICLYPHESTSQLLLRHQSMSSECFATLLEEEYNIAFESLNTRSVLLHLNIGLPDAAFDALKIALQKLDNQVSDENNPHAEVIEYQFKLPVRALLPREAFFTPGELISKESSVGRVSRQIVASCPPGIPVIMPGEVIDASHLPFLPDEIDVVK